MNASKERANQAHKALVKVSDGMPEKMRNQYSAQLIIIEEFIEAARRKLPSEAAFEAQSQRSKATKEE